MNSEDNPTTPSAPNPSSAGPPSSGPTPGRETLRPRTTAAKAAGSSAKPAAKKSAKKAATKKRAASKKTAAKKSTASAKKATAAPAPAAPAKKAASAPAQAASPAQAPPAQAPAAQAPPAQAPPAQAPPAQQAAPPAQAPDTWTPGQPSAPSENQGGRPKRSRRRRQQPGGNQNHGQNQQQQPTAEAPANPAQGQAPQAEAPAEGGQPQAQPRQQHQQQQKQHGHEGQGGRRRRRKRKPKNKEPEVLGPPRDGEGLFEISPKGFGFLRTRENGFKQHPGDVFVAPEHVRNLGLRQGLWIEGEVRDSNRGPQMAAIHRINGGKPEKYTHLPLFEELKAINPDKRIILETTPERYTTRVIDMMAPIGRGQRGLIVAPPRAGKTTLLQHIAEAVAEKHDDLHLILLLVDERPEEVTELARSLPSAEVYASSNDNDVKNHTRVAELCIDRAKRLVEAGENVFILLDSITRLGRAFNNSGRKGKGGRTMSGGIDARALEIPRRIFAAARNTRGGGSLTILGTALIETGSKADELIFQEFKGTGNMELVLDRRIAQQYIYPAVDIFKSGTRREELLLPAHQLAKIQVIRRGLSGHKPDEAIQRLLTFCEKFPNNNQMLIEIPGA